MYKIIGEPTSYSHPKNDKSFTYQREGDEMVFDFWSDKDIEKLYLPQGFTYEANSRHSIGITGESEYPVFKNEDDSVRPIYKGNTYIRIKVKGWVKEVDDFLFSAKSLENRPVITTVTSILFDTSPLKPDRENIRKERINLLFENKKLKEENGKLLKNKQALIEIVEMLLKK